MGSPAVSGAVESGALTERDLYAKIYANSQDSVFLLEPGSGQILFVNPRAVEDTSYEIEELLELKFNALFLPEDQEAVTTLLKATVEWNNGIDPQRVLKRKSGKKIFVEIATLSVNFEGGKVISC